jgi:hypothetical protein
VATSSNHIYQKDRKKKMKVLKVGAGNNRAYQTPIAGETTNALREGWLSLISGVPNLP